MGSAELTRRIRDLEELLLDPRVRRSREALRDLLADEFLEFGSSGRCFTISETVEALVAEAAEEPRFSVVDFSLLVLAPDVALARYRTEARGRHRFGAQYSLRSSVWVFRSGRWQLLFHQGTPTASRSGLPAAGRPV
jgi:hypothetical protein